MTANEAVEQGLREAALAIYQPVPRDGGLGGSSPDHIRTDIISAMTAVGDAVTALAKTYPNGRDYGPVNLHLSTIAHRSRLARLSSVLLELDALIISWEDS